MVAWEAFHAITAGLTTGMLALALFAILVKLYADARPQHDGRLGVYADGAAIFGVSVGLVFMLGALVTGFAQWPLEAYLNSPIAKNKIFTALVALMFWVGFLLLRWRAGDRLWRDRRLVALYLFLALGGFAYIVFTNSIGGHIAGKPSGFERLVMAVGIETRRTFTLPEWVSGLLILLGLAGIGWGLLRHRAPAG
ncbi:MAG: hypothetical protein V3V07_10980 [candidate division NC10 bacterium]|jgi:hypothetical protein